MRNQLGITQWTVPWTCEDLCRHAKDLGLSALHLDLGSADDGYPMTDRKIRDSWLESTARYGLEIVSLALNDLCSHGFTAGLQDPRSETAAATVACGIETAAAMGIPSVSVPHFFANRITDSATFRASAEALRRLCDLASEKGILVYTENVLGREQLTRLWNEVDRENLRLLFDSQNYSAMAGTDAVEIFRSWKDCCGSYLHIKDGIAPELGSRPLWQGDSRFEDIFSVILNSGYSGAVILESNYPEETALTADLEKVRRRISR